jgi:hypothetical protein
MPRGKRWSVTCCTKTKVKGTPRSTQELNIVAKVSSKLAESMVPTGDSREPPRQSDKARDDFLELIIYGNKAPAVADFFHQFFRAGAGVITFRIDPLMTNQAIREFFRYNLEESLQKLLAAFRARNWVNWNVALVKSHEEARVYQLIIERKASA